VSPFATRGDDSTEPVPTVDGVAIPEVADRARMRRERHARLQAQLAAHGLDAVLLSGTANVAYAVGADAPASDPARSMLARQVALVVRGESAPYLRTPYPEGAPAELDPDRVAPAAYPDLDDGAAELVAWVAERVPAGARVGIDEVTHPLRRAFATTAITLESTSRVMSTARVTKTADELACIRAAEALTEAAMVDAHAALRPGVRQSDLTAIFLKRVFELGVENVGVDPIWQPIPTHKADGPRTVHGDLGFPSASTQATLAGGDVVWNDTGLHVGGYASDFGRTWIVSDDPRPTDAQLAQYTTWRTIVAECKALAAPGVDTLQLCRLATKCNGGTKPWLAHFYLAHGIGTSSAEMPLVGTDLGEAFDERQVLSPGMVLVFEPVVWTEGVGGYRAEEIVAVTDDGTVSLSGDFPWAPFPEEGP
jgi:Xaa-Pro aminopeptidase